MPVSTSAPPVLTVRYDASERTFAAGNDVVIGRDLRADVRVGHPLISRAHLIVRFDQGRWIAIDNGSLNGMYVNNRRVPYADIQDGQRINIGNPDGPALTFEVGRHQGSAGRPPLTTSIPLATAAGAHPAPPHGDPSRPASPQQSAPTTRMPPAYPPNGPQPAHRLAVRSPPTHPVARTPPTRTAGHRRDIRPPDRNPPGRPSRRRRSTVRRHRQESTRRAPAVIWRRR